MTLQFSTTLRNDQLNQIETTIGASPKLRISTGAAPANCAAADSGTLIVEIPMPSDWMAAAASGQKGIANGPWSASATSTNTAGHFRIKDNAGSNVHMQGSVTATGGGGDLQLDNTSITNGQTVSISVFTITAANA